MLGATNLVENSNKSKWVYIGYGIAFHGADSWSFGDNFAKNAKVFGVNNSSLSRTDSRKNDFLVLGKGPTYDINGILAPAEQKLNINFSKGKASKHYKQFANGIETYSFKASNGRASFPSSFF